MSRLARGPLVFLLVAAPGAWAEPAPASPVAPAVVVPPAPPPGTDVAPTAPEAELAGAGAGEVIVVEDEVASPSSRLAQPARETPASVVEVDDRALRARGINDFSSAMATVAGVSPSLRYGGFDHLTIRGFGGEDYLLLSDGFRDERGPIVGGEIPVGPMVGLERIEVLKGPASLLYGPSALGGVINVIRHQPQATPSYEFGAGVGTYGDRRAWLGVAGPLDGRDPARLHGRFDLRTSVAGNFRGQEDEQAGATGALSYRVRPGHLLDGRATWSKSSYRTDAGLPTLDGEVPPAIAASTRFNSPYDHLRYDNAEVSVGYTGQLRSGLTLRQRFLWNRFREDYLSTEVVSLAAEAPTKVTRSFFRFDHHGQVALNQLELGWRGHAGVDHDLVLGYDLSRLDFRSPSGFADAAPVDAVAFVEPQGQPDVPFTSETTRDQTLHAVFVADTIAVGALRAVAGARLDVLDVVRVRDRLDPATGMVTETGQRFTQTTVAPSFRTGLVYLVSEQLAPYASFTTSVRPVMPWSIPDNADALEPELGRQLELGARVTLGSSLELHAAGFHLVKRNMVVTRPMMVYEQAGRARSLGAELALRGRWARLDLDAGYALVQARYTAYTSDDLDLAGRHLPDVPTHTLTGWSTWRGPWGLSLGLGGRYASRAFADRANQTPLPAYLIADGALGVTRGGWQLSLVVKNLLGRNPLDDRGRYFVSTIYDTQVTPGPPRTALVQLELRR